LFKVSLLGDAHRPGIEVGAHGAEPCGSCPGSMPKLCELEAKMHGLIYLIGLIVVILAILSFFGLR
jgi:hypothetical protein